MSPLLRIAAAAVATGLAAVAALTGTAAAAAAPGPATGNGAWSVGPANRSAAPAARPFFSFEAPAGATVRDVVRITNMTEAPITFEVYGTDAYNTPRDAGFALRGAEEEPRDVGAWISLKAASPKIPGGKAREIPFTLKIPADATPGEHIGGIVALNTAIESVQRSGGARVGIRRAVGARVYLRVTGPLTPGMRADGLGVARTEPLVPFVRSGRGTVRYTIVNTGNQRISPTARVRATGVFGREVKRWPDQRIPEILPGERTEITLPWNGPPALDKVTVRVELTAAGGIDVRAQTGFTAVPWAALLVLAGTVFVVWSVLPRLIRRWRERAGLTSGETGVFM
ncbi:DUF916 domain-containing protein [Actinomadura sp. 7K534]|uniref:DUF916 domain-containing protein n=1 Tax=Actinomadura sp. 7K534 TaxID=2530366 RepID=UPI001045BED2|nr:DUF916 domain-containing protein [Actinomadura sp. 7K534]TDB94356.1 DUF916 domain-containing protein [Actinomadura sp. 7K534]